MRDTAAALKAANFASACSYLDELRLAHVEADFGVSDPLAREFHQCKLSVTRGLGPPCKAAELKDEEVQFDVLPTAGDLDSVARPLDALGGCCRLPSA